MKEDNKEIQDELDRIWKKPKRSLIDWVYAIMGVSSLLFGVLCINLLGTLFDDLLYRTAFVVCGVLSFCTIWTRVVSNIELETLRIRFSYHELSDRYSELDLYDRVNRLDKQIRELTEKEGRK